jgi:hypothetical protein
MAIEGNVCPRCRRMVANTQSQWNAAEQACTRCAPHSAHSWANARTLLPTSLHRRRPAASSPSG